MRTYSSNHEIMCGLISYCQLPSMELPLKASPPFNCLVARYKLPGIAPWFVWWYVISWSEIWLDLKGEALSTLLYFCVEEVSARKEPYTYIYIGAISFYFYEVQSTSILRVLKNLINYIDMQSCCHSTCAKTTCFLKNKLIDWVLTFFSLHKKDATI